MVATTYTGLPPQNNAHCLMSPNELQVADIILTRSTGVGGFLITRGTQSSYAHAMVYIGMHNRRRSIVDAMPPERDDQGAIRLLPVNDALSGVNRAAVYRHPSVNSASAQLVRQYLLRAYHQGGRITYDFSALRRPWDTGDGVIDAIAGQAFWAWRAERASPGSRNAYHCSELVVSAFREAAVQFSELSIEHHLVPDDREEAIRHGQSRGLDPEFYSPGSIASSTSLRFRGYLVNRTVNCL